MNDMKLMTIRQEFQTKYFSTKYSIKNNCFHNLQWSENKSIYLAYRTLMMLYSLSWFLVDIITNEDEMYFFYISNWTEITQCLYFSYSFMVALRSVSTKDLKIDDNKTICDKNESVYNTNQARWILLNISASSSIVICILFWIGQASNLINKQTVLFSVTVHVHLICCVMSIVEVSLIKLPIRILHFYQPVSLSFAYMILTLVLSKTYPPVYQVLDWVNNPVIAAVCSLSGTFLVVPFVHCCIVYPLYRLRVLFAMKLKQKAHERGSFEKSSPVTSNKRVERV